MLNYIIEDVANKHLERFKAPKTVLIGIVSDTFESDGSLLGDFEVVVHANAIDRTIVITCEDQESPSFVEFVRSGAFKRAWGRS